MTRFAKTSMSEPLLELLAVEGEMKAQDFLTYIQRKRGDYLDFYPVAALLHAGYITTDSETATGGKTIEGKLGANLQDTAVFLCQLALPPGQSFQINNCPRDSAHDFPVNIFMTADGYLRLDEVEQRRLERKRKRTDYDLARPVWLFSLLVFLTIATLVVVPRYGFRDSLGSTSFLFGLFAALLVGYGGAVVTRSMKRNFRREYQCAGDVAKYLSVHRPQSFKKDWTKEEVAGVVREIIVDETGVKDFTEDSHFINDMHLD